jgi:hypothetical protein
MLKNYIALLFGATLLYGCGGSNSFDSNAPSDSTEQYAPATGDVVDIAEGDSGYRFDLKGDDHFDEGDDYRNFVFRAMDSNDSESVKEANAAYRFLRTWTTNTAGLEEEVDFSAGDAVAIAIGYTDLGDKNNLEYRVIDFDELVYYAESSQQDFTEVHYTDTVADASTGYIFPYDIVRFPLVGESVRFERNGEKRLLNSAEPTYRELVIQDLNRRIGEGEDLSDSKFNFSRNDSDVLAHECPNRHDSTLVVTDNIGAQEVAWSPSQQASTAAFCPLDGSYYFWNNEDKIVKGPFTPGQPATTSEKE